MIFLELQWNNCWLNRKVLYPIAKKKVVSATKICDYDTKESISNVLGNNVASSYTIYSWILTADDYIVGRDPYTNQLNTLINDVDRYCFICY